MKPPVDETTLKALAAFDTCTIANAIESFRVRLRNEGFTRSGLQCHFPQFAPMVGYAFTMRVRSGNPPMEGGTYLDRADWWSELDLEPEPHIVLIEDADTHTGTGAFVGEIHAAILQALGCVGVITNGAVRDLPAVGKLGFQLFSGSVSVSHAYTHVIEVNGPVTIAGLRIAPGDLLHGDRHGVVSIPPGIASEIPAVVAGFKAREREILEHCRSTDFSIPELLKILGRSA